MIEGNDSSQTQTDIRQWQELEPTVANDPAFSPNFGDIELDPDSSDPAHLELIKQIRESAATEAPLRRNFYFEMTPERAAEAHERVHLWSQAVKQQVNEFLMSKNQDEYRRLKMYIAGVLNNTVPVPKILEPAYQAEVIKLIDIVDPITPEVGGRVYFKDDYSQREFKTGGLHRLQAFFNEIFRHTDLAQRVFMYLSIADTRLHR